MEVQFKNFDKSNLDRTLVHSKIAIFHAYSAVQLETAANFTCLHSNMAILHLHSVVQVETSAHFTTL